MTTLTTTSAPPKTPKLTSLSRVVNDALERILPSAQRPPAVIHDAMRYCVFSGGKRFRPLLSLGACEAVGAPARSITRERAAELEGIESVLRADA